MYESMNDNYNYRLEDMKVKLEIESIALNQVPETISERDEEMSIAGMEVLSSPQQVRQTDATSPDIVEHMEVASPLKVDISPDREAGEGPTDEGLD